MPTPISVGSGEAIRNPAMTVDKYFCHRPKASRSSFLNTSARWVWESWLRSLVKKPLKKKKIAFLDCNVAESQNSQFRDELLDKSGQISVPVFDFDGVIVVGFSEQKLEEALAKAQK